MGLLNFLTVFLYCLSLLPSMLFSPLLHLLLIFIVYGEVLVAPSKEMKSSFHPPPTSRKGPFLPASQSKKDWTTNIQHELEHLRGNGPRIWALLDWASRQDSLPILSTLQSVLAYCPTLPFPSVLAPSLLIPTALVILRAMAHPPTLSFSCYMAAQGPYPL